MTASLQVALEHQLAGNLAGARLLYEALLDEDPQNVAALNLLGLGLCQGADPARGLDLLREAVLIADNAVSHLGLGEGLLLAGRAKDAAGSFRRSLLRDPGFAPAQAGLGRALRALGDLPGAEAALRAAITLAPEAPATHLELAGLLRQAGRPMEAATAADAAIRLDLKDAAAWSVLGNALLDAGEPAAAVQAQTQAALLAPDDAVMQYNLGNALRADRREADAVAAFVRAIRRQPAFPEAVCNLGAALTILGRFEEAEAAARHALDLRPEFPDAQLNLGNALQAQFRFPEAEAAYRAAQAQAGGSDRIAASAASNLGTALTAQGRLDEAMAALDTALALHPTFADAAYNRAVTLLTAGDYVAGWPAWEARWRMGWSAPRAFSQPQWRGEALQGLTILLHAEQGLGDTIQFVRYARLVRQRGARVVLEVQAPLVRLLRAQPGLADSVVEQGHALPAFDLHCPLMSLPLAFATTLDDIPAAPYLIADPASLPPGRPRVGLVWAGAARIGHVDSQRSLPLHRLAPLLRAAPGAEFFALQKEATDADIAAAGLALHNPMPGVADFADTAALVAAMDLVIAVDTSTAHLAAALGRPVWLLSRCNGCWRWMTERSDSPWYPTLRIYRQDRPGDWAPAIARIAADLARFSETSAGG